MSFVKPGTAKSSRPHYDEDVVYHVDDTLTSDLYKHVKKVLPTLSKEMQAHLRDIGLHGGYWLEGDFECVFANAPQLKQRLDDNAPYPTASLHLGLVLLTWALNTSPGLYNKGVLQKQFDTFWPTPYELSSKACALVETLVNLQPFMKGTTKKMVPFFIDCIDRNATWSHASNAHFKTHYLTLVFQALKEDANALRAWEHKTLEAFTSQNRWHRPAFARAFASSAIALAQKRNILESCRIDVWAEPEVAALLVPALPQDEYQRLLRLPTQSWEPPSCNANRNLVQLYCPMLFGMLDLGMPPQMWSSMHNVRNYVRQMKRMDTPEQYVLPSDNFTYEP